jgi:histidine triad (HIT) family protein
MIPQKTCLFCRIAKKEIASTILYEDEDLVAFKDVSPKAPVHFLIIPKEHLEDHLQLHEKDSGWIGRTHLLANQLAKDLRIDDGFRLVVNCRQRAGQSVDHLHMHVMGGRDFSWPPG